MDGEHVLLVDDDPALAQMYRLGLEMEGFRVSVLETAVRLNEEVESRRPDLVVLDWELPGILGDEALVRLRRTPRGLTSPVVVLSNFPGTRHGAIDRVFAAGAIAWLEKISTTPTDLARRLRQVMEGRPGTPGGASHN